jgi:hypothetical protein
MPVLDAGAGRAGTIALFLTDIARLSGNRLLFSVAAIGLINLIQDDPAFLRIAFADMDDAGLAEMRDFIVAGDRVSATGRMRALFAGKIAEADARRDHGALA